MSILVITTITRELKAQTSSATKKGSADITVSGVVIDENGEKVVGASIRVEGTSSGTISDLNGKFNLLVPVNATLQVSFIGYSTSKVPVQGNANLKIKLVPNNNMLDEVVAIGYGTMRRSDLTGSAVSVQSKELTSIPVKSFDEALAGRVAGVQVVSADGQPGSMPSIIIRGASSLTQDNSPLYVIDGFPIENNDNNAINSSDIESIDILKDASATAIYGARGANGVIMITTKKGKTGAPVINYNTYYATQKATNKIEVMSPYEFIKIQLEGNLDNATNFYLTTPGYTLDDYKTMKGVDWFDKILQSAPSQNHDISVRGGTGKNKYSISGSYYDQKGIFINTGFSRWQGRISLDQAINDKLNTGINVNYSSAKDYGQLASQGSSSAGIIYSMWAFRPVFPEPNVDLDVDLNDPTVNPATDYKINPYLSLKNENRNNYSRNLSANGFLEYTIIKDLKLRITGGVNNRVNQIDVFNNSKTASGNPRSTNYLGVNGSENFITSTNYSNDNTLTWSKKFNSRNNINVVGGFSQQMGKYENFGTTVVMISNEDLGMAALDEGSATRVNAGRSIWALQSFLGRVNYNYKSKYLLTASIRADGSSKLAHVNRWGYFPSAALAYRLSEEKFMKRLTFVDNSKFRISYGATGNNRVSDFAYLSSMTSSYNDYSFGNATPSPGTVATALGNTALKWETTKQFNTGIDLGFFNNRLSITADYYNKFTTDLLLNADIPYTSGYPTTYKNIGSVSNEGFELAINTTNVRSKDFEWISNFNISFNKNKVISLTENQEAILSVIKNANAGFTASAPYIAKIGDPIALFYGLISDGLYTYDDFVMQSNGTYILKDNIPTNGAARQNIKPGFAKFKDLNGDGVISEKDQTIIGNPNPKFIGGLNNTIKYKGFDLNVFFQFSYGNDILNANRLSFEGNNTFSLNNNYYATYANRWTEENPNGIYPRLNGTGNTFYSSRYIEDGSYLRLKTISLGYSIPKEFLSKFKIKEIRAYCTAQNLLTWTKYSGLDPEVSTRNTALTPGFDYSPYPRAKSLVFGLNLTL